MKIVQALGWYSPDSLGGTEVYVNALAHRFRTCGHQVAIAAPRAGASEPQTYVHDGCEVYRYPIPAAPTRDEAQGRVPARGAEHLHQWLANAGADVVHVHTFVTGLGLHEIAAARRAARRVIVTTHASSLGFLCQRGTLMWRGVSLCDGIVDRVRCASCELEHRGASPTLAALVGRVPPEVGRLARAFPGSLATAVSMGDLIDHNQRQQAEMLRLADRFVVLTTRAAEIVMANGAPASKVVVNRLGISQDRPFTSPERAARSAGPVRLGYVGRFDVVKGIFDLAEALRRLPSDAPLRCEFRGPAMTDQDRRARAELQRMFAGDARVRFADAVPSADILDVMRSYDVLCCPSRCLEGGPTAGLEALAAGTPVIAADAGGLAEVIDDGVSGRLVPAGDVGALTAAIHEIVRDPRATLDRWREHLPRPRTMRDVASDYLALYGATN